MLHYNCTFHSYSDLHSCAFHISAIKILEKIKPSRLSVHAKSGPHCNLIYTLFGFVGNWAEFRPARYIPEKKTSA